MTPVEIAAYIRAKTKTNSTTFTDASMLAFFNQNMDDMAVEIAKANEDMFAILRTGNLVANTREYALGADVISLKTLEVMLDGINFRRLHPFDLSDVSITTSESDIRLYFTGKDPRFDLFNRSFFIYSEEAILTVANGYQMRVAIFPEHLTDFAGVTDLSVDSSALTRGFPRQFHELLARRTIIDFKESRDKPIPLTQTELKFEKDFTAKIASIRNRAVDNAIRATLPFNDGSNY